MKLVSETIKCRMLILDVVVWTLVGLGEPSTLILTFDLAIVALTYKILSGVKVMGHIQRHLQLKHNSAIKKNSLRDTHTTEPRKLALNRYRRLRHRRGEAV